MSCLGLGFGHPSPVLFRVRVRVRSRVLSCLGFGLRLGHPSPVLFKALCRALGLNTGRVGWDEGGWMGVVSMRKAKGAMGAWNMGWDEVRGWGTENGTRWDEDGEWDGMG